MTGAPQGPVILPAPDPTTRRISLRRQTPDGVSDVVDHLIAANADWLVVLPEDRPAVWVPRGEASAIREVPERLVLASSGAEQVERLLERGLPASARARLGGWVLRRGQGDADPGWVLGAGDPGMPFAAAVAAAEEWVGGALRLRVVVGGETEREALAAGFAPVGEAVVSAEAPLVPRGSARTDAAFLVVDADDTAALARHSAQGLVEHHRHRYLAR